MPELAHATSGLAPEPLTPWLVVGTSITAAGFVAGLVKSLLVHRGYPKTRRLPAILLCAVQISELVILVLLSFPLTSLGDLVNPWPGVLLVAAVFFVSYIPLAAGANLLLLREKYARTAPVRGAKRFLYAGLLGMIFPTFLIGLLSLFLLL